MPQIAVAYSVKMETTECVTCGIMFAFPVGFDEERRKDHKGFYCPNGHSQHYTAESDAERNARLLKEEQARHQRTITRNNELAEEKAKLERKLRRVDRGVCPECNRSFTNLARHMACKHKSAA